MIMFYFAIFISYSAYRARKVLIAKKSVTILNRTVGSIIGLVGTYLISKN